MWRKSSRSGGTGNNCVEVRKLSTDVDVRDSKLGDASPILSVSRSEFASILGALKILGSLIRTPAVRRGPFLCSDLPLQFSQIQYRIGLMLNLPRHARLPL